MANKKGILEINAFLNEYVEAVGVDVDKAAKDAADAAQNYLKSNSPKRKGSYSRGWEVTKQNGKYVVHNKRHYQLTHLLEKGHDVVAYGKKVGRTKAQPHIKQANDLAIEQFEKELKEKIQNEH